MPPELVIERRTAMRYKLRLPVIFHWNDGTEQTDGGFTTDVALDGALILSSRCPPVGADVRIEVLIPSLGQNAEEIRIECVGTVTRVAQQPGSGYFGVRGMFNDNQLTRHVFT
jgi:PilZ domain